MSHSKMKKCLVFAKHFFFFYCFFYFLCVFGNFFPFLKKIVRKLTGPRARLRSRVRRSVTIWQIFSGKSRPCDRAARSRKDYPGGDRNPIGCGICFLLSNNSRTVTERAPAGGPICRSQLKIIKKFAIIYIENRKLPKGA